VNSTIEIERRNRIRLAVFAYAYECENVSLISDAEFDELSKTIKPTKRTGNRVMDKFFKTKFDPCTGMWIHQHPQLERIKQLYEMYYK
jgi:hypothetical protein